MARQFWPEQEALGKRFKFFGQDWWNEVVGIAADGKYNFLGENPQPYIYQSLDQVYDPTVSLLLRAAGDPATALGMARAEVQALDRLLPITNVQTFREILRQSLWAPRMGASLLAVFGLLSLLLAVIGIYGVMSYSVSQRTRELGLRMALGADERSLLKLVVAQGLALTGLGIVVGLALAFALTRLVSSMLFEVKAQDPLIFAGVPLLLGLAALVASVQPALRAARIDPTQALRIE
jgi:ABC-type antimicrobial peptide transport system permease subunit